MTHIRKDAGGRLPTIAKTETEVTSDYILKISASEDEKEEEDTNIKTVTTESMKEDSPFDKKT